MDCKNFVAVAFSFALVMISGSPGTSAAAMAIDGDAPLHLKGVEIVRKEGTTGVLIDLSSAPVTLKHFTLKDPSRLVIDVQGSTPSEATALVRTVADDPLVSRVRTGVQDKRLRIVLDLKVAAPQYLVKAEEGRISALLDEKGEIETPPSPVASTASKVPDARSTSQPATAASLPAVDPVMQLVSALAPREASAAVSSSAEVAPPTSAKMDGASASPAADAAPARPIRDPFRPFNMTMQPKTARPTTPLQQYELGALKLVAVVYDPRSPRAMVEDEGGFGHSVTVGTKIGNRDGVIRTIEPDRVVVAEDFVDFYGEKKTSERVLRLQPGADKGAR